MVQAANSDSVIDLSKTRCKVFQKHWIFIFGRSKLETCVPFESRNKRFRSSNNNRQCRDEPN